MGRQDRDRPLSASEIEDRQNDVYIRTFSTWRGGLGERRRKAKSNDKAANIRHGHATKSSRLWRKVKKILLGNAASNY